MVLHHFSMKRLARAAIATATAAACKACRSETSQLTVSSVHLARILTGASTGAARPQVHVMIAMSK